MAAALIPSEVIENKIFYIRGKKVMIDRDLAALYDVTTGNLNKAVKRNIERFPEDFMFTLTPEEYTALRFHFGSLKRSSQRIEKEKIANWVSCEIIKWIRGALLMPKKILMVEDEADIRDAVEASLKSRGYLVIAAADGEEALHKVKSEKPDLVLLDIIMPKLDGWQVLKAIRDDEATRELPVVMLTANRETSSLIESQSQRATDYLMKPFDIEKLLKFIHRYI